MHHGYCENLDERQLDRGQILLIEALRVKIINNGTMVILNSAFSSGMLRPSWPKHSP